MAATTQNINISIISIKVSSQYNDCFNDCYSMSISENQPLDFFFFGNHMSIMRAMQP